MPDSIGNQAPDLPSRAFLMLKQNAKIVARTLYAVDIAVTVSSFYAAYWLRGTLLAGYELPLLYPIAQYTWLLVVIIPAWTYFLHKNGAYASQRVISFQKEMMIVWKAVAFGGIVIGTIAFAFKSNYLSRTLILTFVIVNPLLLTVERFCVRMLARIVRRRGYNYRNVLIVGTGEAAHDIARRIKKYDYWGLRIAGLVAENSGHHSSDVVEGCPVIGNLPDIERIVKQEVVDEVIFAVSNTRLEELEDTFLMLEDQGINAGVVTSMFPHLIAKVSLEELETVPLLTFTTVPTNTSALMLKRCFDIIAGAGLFMVNAPVMLIAAVLVKATSPGPVFFVQKRSGLHGRIFTLYKFRSMYVGAEERKKELDARNEMEGPVFKMKDDPRVTPVGRFIRSTSIDELPQLWNVLKGDMSIVGPRPPLPDEVAQYKRWQRRRLSMRPGLTCLWQISGRNSVRKFDDWVKLDLQYIDTWSLALDLKIFLKTIPVVLFRSGAT